MGAGRRVGVARDPRADSRRWPTSSDACRSCGGCSRLGCFYLLSKHLHLPLGIERVDGRKAFARQFLYGATAFFLLLPAVFGPQDRGLVRRLLRWKTDRVFRASSPTASTCGTRPWIGQAVEWQKAPDFLASFPAVPLHRVGVGR